MNVIIADFLTVKQIQQCIKIYKQCVKEGVNPHKRILHEVIWPNMEQIDAKIGQKNDPGYIAYSVEYAIAISGKVGKK
jgi:hypothetical protein